MMCVVSRSSRSRFTGDRELDGGPKSTYTASQFTQGVFRGFNTRPSSSASEAFSHHPTEDLTGHCFSFLRVTFPPGRRQWPQGRLNPVSSGQYNSIFCPRIKLCPRAFYPFSTFILSYFFSLFSFLSLF